MAGDETSQQRRAGYGTRPKGVWGGDVWSSCWWRAGATLSGFLVLAVLAVAALVPREAIGASGAEVIQQLVSTYCIDCHQGDEASGGLDIETLEFEFNQNHKAPSPRHSKIVSAENQERGVSEDKKLPSDWDPAPWEKMLKRLKGRQMPPVEAFRPSEAEYRQAVQSLTGVLDRAAKVHPRPGRTEPLRRLNRTEYRNAIRDLLSLEIEVDELLPADESGHGFDNVTVSELSPMLLDRYITAAQQISRLAVGSARSGPIGVNHRVAADQSQESHVDGLPFGTRGGTLFRHHFLQSGEYEFQIRLARDRDEHVEGLHEAHDIHVLIDRDRVHEFTVKRPKDGDHTHVDTHLKTRLQVQAGPHDVGVTFPQKGASLLETKRQPFDARFNRHRHPRSTPAIFEVSITGPFLSTGPDQTPRHLTPSRERIFICRPDKPAEAASCGEQILSNLMRQAYRRPVTEADLKTPMEFFWRGLEESGFEAGVQAGLTSILVNPNFLFRLETEPESAPSGTAYQISDIELASRLSFFLWSSLPDKELLQLAEQKRLREPSVLEDQVRRMLGDERAESLADNFADQWLHLRNLASATPDMRRFPDFDDNLRQSFRKETQLVFANIVREDRSVVQLISSHHTYLNQRLAKHYGIPGVFGSHFRRVELDPTSHRGGLLRHGSILTVTSYATRTSPTIRGNWILENIIGTPPPPPPANVPALKEKTTLTNLTVRERLAGHRANPACASCHDLMDPVGFALENFDAVGRWREFEDGAKIDVSGVLPDGSEIRGTDDLESGILERPEMFVETLVGKLLTFALGRGMEPTDQPAIRQIVRNAREQDYRFSQLILGIVRSKPFQMREAK